VTIRGYAYARSGGLLAVGVALVVGLGGGVVGTLISTGYARTEGERQRKYEQRERMRDRRIDAGEDFLQAISLAIRWLAYLVSNRDERELHKRAGAALIDVARAWE
jgi:hypothetical protein